MAYTLTQARPLLNAAELELFEQSRSEPIKRLTPAKLAGAVKRTRTPRDKYRDLYQRQTVAVRTSTPGAVTGDDNERTQRKADILQEVLERYEARVTLLNERDSSTAKDSHTDTYTVPAGKDSAKSRLSKDKKAGATQTPRTSAAAPSADAGKTAKSTSSTKAPKAEKSAGSAKKLSMSKQLNTLAGAGVSTSADKKDKGNKADKGDKPEKGTAAPRGKRAGSPPARSAKAPSRKAPTANNKTSAPDINAPLDIVPAAKRASPLKQDPTNLAINAHQSSQGRRTQGKRDSR